MSKKPCSISFKSAGDGVPCTTVINGKLVVKGDAVFNKNVTTKKYLNVNNLIFSTETIDESGQKVSPTKSISFINTNGVGELDDACCDGFYKKIIKINDSTFNYTEQQKLTASDGATYDTFGNSVSINADGSKAIIGAYGDDIVSGSAYIFGLSGGSWVEQQKLTTSDRAISDFFGFSVSINADGSKAIIGAYGDDDFKGSAYIFGVSGGSWVQQQKLTASDGATSDNFGYSVSINADGSKAIIGAYRDDDSGNDSGSAYIFGLSGGSWVQQQKLTAGDGATGDSFGYSVSINADGSKAIIGAFGNDDSGNNSGSAYIFGVSGGSWVEQQKLTASDGATNDRFGNSVSINSDGSKAIIGAYGDDSGKGSSYIFGLSGGSWVEQQKLTTSDGATGDSFGNSVSINADGSKAIIGANRDDIFKGSVYIFGLSGGSWVQQQKLTASDGATGDADFFGFSVSISSDSSRAIIGAQLDDDKGSDSGSAYIFGGTASGYELTYNDTETLTLTNKGDNATLIYNSDPTAGWIKLT